MRELLSQVDVWVIPQTNPGGRDLDDLAHGDPTQFAYVCDVGASAGEACSSDADCPGGGCWKTGWRGNANTGSCELGIDLARNYSAGWDMASSMCLAQRVCRGAGGYTTTPCSSDSDCTFAQTCKNVRMHYRGPDPFSEPESLNLRRFVHKHMLSMVTIVHSNSHELWHRWRPVNQASWYLANQLLSINSAGSAGYTPSPAMFIDSVGGARATYSASHTFSMNATYRVEIELDADDFGGNNSKIFAFRVLDAWPFWRQLVIGWSKTSMSERKEGSADDRLQFKGKFMLGQAPHPETTGLNVFVHGYPSLGSTQGQASAPVSYQLPTGSPWWDKSKPEKGRWVYSDKKGAMSPVSKVLIKQRIDKDTGNRLTKVAVKLADADLSSLATSRSYAVQIDLSGDGLLLSSPAARKHTKLPDKLLPPDDETEEAPDFGQ